jgi:hypothetical protein
MASKDLTGFELNREMTIWTGDWHTVSPPHVGEIRIRLGSYRYAWGATYQEALDRLMGTWDPDVATEDEQLQPAVDSRQRMLERMREAGLPAPDM